MRAAYCFDDVGWVSRTPGVRWEAASEREPFGFPCRSCLLAIFRADERDSLSIVFRLLVLEQL